MSNKFDSSKIDILELINMCDKNPENVSLSNRAVSDGHRDFNLASEAEIKTFIGDGNLEDLVFKTCAPSDKIPGVIITPYIFRTGTKFGYVAYHYKANDKSKIHIKSFHKDEMNPKSPISSLADFFPKTLVGGKNE